MTGDAMEEVRRLQREAQRSDFVDSGFPDLAVRAATRAAAVALWGRPADADAMATARVAVDAALPHLRDCPCPCFTAGQAAARRAVSQPQQTACEMDELVTGLRELVRGLNEESGRYWARSGHLLATSGMGDPASAACSVVARALSDVSQKLQQLADGPDHD